MPELAVDLWVHVPGFDWVSPVIVVILFEVNGFILRFVHFDKRRFKIS